MNAWKIAALLATGMIVGCMASSPALKAQNASDTATSSGPSRIGVPLLLDRTDLRQLAQRITGRYHLEPLSREETRGYIRHRLRVAGAPEEIFTASALAEVHRLAAGIPRVINVTCDRALLGAYTQEKRKVSAALVRLAAGASS